MPPMTVKQLLALISIHLHWFLLKILAITMILRGVGWSLVGSGSGGGWSRSKENNTYLLTVNV